MPGQVFISYSRNDERYAASLARILTDIGVPVWFDHALTAGDQWSRHIEQQIETCSAFVVIMTPTAAQSSWVQRELTHAEQLRKPVLPLLLDGDPWFRLNDTQYTDVRDHRPPPAAFTDRVLTIAEPPKTTTAAATTGAARRGRVRPQHAAPVTSLAWCPDGTAFASGSDDTTCRIWNLADGRQKVVLGGHTDAVTAVLWPDTDILATVGLDRTLRTWDPETGEPLHTYHGHGAEITSASATSDGIIATAGYDGEILVWAIPDDIPFRRISTGRRGIYTVKLSQNGKLCAIGAVTRAAAAVEVWDLVSGERIFNLDEDGSSGDHKVDVDWSHDSRLLAVSKLRLSHHGVRIWDSAAGPWKKAARELKTKQGAVRDTSVAWAPHANHLATTGGRNSDGEVKIWDPGTKTPIQNIIGQHPRSLAWSHDGQCLATYHNPKNGRAQIWHVETGIVRRTLNWPVSVAAWSPTDLILATGSDIGLVWRAGLK